MGAKKTTAAKATRKETPETVLLALFDVAAHGPNEEKRQAAMNVIMRAALAALRQSKAEAAYERSIADGKDDIRLGSKANDTQRETCEAGAVLARALKGAIAKPVKTGRAARPATSHRAWSTK